MFINKCLLSLLILVFYFTPKVSFGLQFIDNAGSLYPYEVDDWFNDSTYSIIGWHDRTFKNRFWVNSINGDVPDNAVIYENARNTKLLYYCRGTFHGEFYYGELKPNEGCYIGDPDQYKKVRLLTTYQVLTE